MASGGEPFWKQVGVQTVAGLAVVVIPAGIALLFEPVRTLVANWWSALFSDVAVPLWWVLVLWSVLLISLARAGLRIFHHARQQPELGAYDLYTGDVFFGMRWRWVYSTPGRPSGAEHLTPECLECKRLLRYAEDRFGLPGRKLHVYCQRCETGQWFDHDMDELRKQVHIEIRLKIENGEWNEAVPRAPS